MYKKLLDNGLNIQLFGDDTQPPVPSGTGDSGQGTGTNGDDTHGDDTQPPAPSGTGDGSQQSTQDDWSTITPDNFKNIKQEHINEYLESAKRNGISPAVALHQLTARENYISTQREAMTPELRELDPIIENFISQEENQEFKDVLERLAENSLGRKFLQQKFLLNDKGGGVNFMDKGKAGTMTQEEFISKYNDAYSAKKSGDSSKMQELETFARNSDDGFFKDFLMLDK
ncbi:MAG: hypothetical protein ACRCUR_03540 [Cetobacterium sp.]